MKQEKEILCTCINHENCPLDPVSCGCSIETTTFEDACIGKRTFIPGIECDKWGWFIWNIKKNGALAIGAVLKLKKEYFVEIPLQGMAF